MNLLSQNPFQILSLICLLSSISLSCSEDEQDSNENTSSPGKINSIAILMNRVNDLLVEKSNTCCMTPANESNLNFGSFFITALFGDLEGKGWIKFNSEKATACYEAFKTKLNTATCEDLNDPAKNDTFEINFEACGIYDALQTENEPCGDPIDESGLTLDGGSVCTGDLYCSKANLNDQNQPTCQNRANGVYCGLVSEPSEGEGYISQYTEGICMPEELCALQREDGRLVAKCVNKMPVGTVCGEVKVEDVFMRIETRYNNCQDDLLCVIQINNHAPQALCSNKLKIGDVCEIQYMHDSTNTLLSYECPENTACLKGDNNQMTCQPRKQLGEVCGEINEFGLEEFGFGVCADGLMCRTKYENGANKIGCQPLSQIGESCQDSWMNLDMFEQSYASSTLCVESAQCNDQNICEDNPSNANEGDACNDEIYCLGDTFCRGGICMPPLDSDMSPEQELPQETAVSFCEDLQ